MAGADALADIDAVMNAGTQGQPSGFSGSLSYGAEPPAALADIDAALNGKSPPPIPERQSNPLQQVGAGINTGLIAGNLGMPVDAMNWFMGEATRSPFLPEGKTRDEYMGNISRGIRSERPVGGSAWWNDQLAKIGLGTGAVPAVTPEERVEQGVGSGIGAMLGPNLLAKGKALTGILGRGATAAEEALAAGSVPANAGIGAISGGAGQGAAELVPDPYKPLAYTVGSLIPGGVLAGGAAAATGLGRGAASVYRSTPPFLGTTREATAGANAAGRFRNAASDPGLALEGIETAPRELVPGSVPTTAELSGDVGLLSAQRTLESNSKDFGRDILEQRGANNTARFGLLESHAPQTASIENTQNHLRQFLANIDNIGNQTVEAQRQNAGTALSPALPKMQPEEQGSLARGAVEAERAPQARELAAGEQSAVAGLNDATGRFGGQAALGAPEEAASAPAMYGQQMREPLAQAYAAEKQRLEALRKSIDPTGTMGMQPTAIKRSLQEINRMFPAESGAQLSGVERHLYDTVAGWGDLIPIERAFQLRANINGRIRGLQGSDPQEALRLGVLKHGVDDAIANAAADIRAGEEVGTIHQGLPPLAQRLVEHAQNANVPPRRPQDLIEFLMERGGLKDEGGELRAMDLHRVNQGYFGRLSRANGMPLDEAREIAAEAGYIHPDSDINDLLSALHRNQSGSRVFREGDPAAFEWQEYERANRVGEEVPFDAARTVAGGELSPGFSVGLSSRGQGATSRGNRANSAEEWRSASVAGDQGVPESLVQLTPEAKQTFSQWNVGYRQMGQMFRGETPGTLHAVGKILQKGGAYDSYRLTDAEVPWLFVNKGPNARQAVDRFLAAAPEEAHAALDDAMAFSLRRAAQNTDGTLNLPKYERWVKDHGAALSARPEMMQKFGQAAQAQRSLDDIRQSLAQHAADHPLKPGWSDSSLLGRFFKPGAEGAEKMREFQRITGNRPEAAEAAADYAAFSFAQSAVRDGEVNPRLAETWLRNHDQALSSVLGLKDKFANATEAQKTLERTIEAHTQARSDYTKSVAGAFIQDDPVRAVNRIFTGANRQQKARLLMDLTKGNAAATEGLQRAAVDYIRQKFEGAPMPGSEAGAMKPKAFADFVGQNRDVLSTLFPGRIANFDALVKDLERSSLVPGAKVNRGGSDTAELTGHGGHDGNDIGAAATVLLAEHAGQHVAHHLGSGLLGAAAAPFALVGRMMLGKARTALTLREDAIFERMLMDPDFAVQMSKAYPGKAKELPPSVLSRLRGRLIQQSIMSARGASLQ